MRQDIQHLTKKVDKQESILGAVVQAHELKLAPLFAPTFEEKYNLQIPITTIEAFLKFNQDLINDQTFCNEFVSMKFYKNPNVKSIFFKLSNFIDNKLSGMYRQ